MNFKDKTVLVWDSGIGVSHAERLCKDFAKVNYFNPWQEQLKVPSYSYGQGIAPNLEKIREFDDYVAKSDLICFLDIGAGDTAKRIKNQGKPVFSGGDGEKFEKYRYKFRMLQQKIGLPTQKTVVIKGTTALREYFKKNPNVYVKVNSFVRGDIESFPVKNFKTTEFKVDEIDTTFGPFKDTFDFMVEEQVESVIDKGAIGIDGWFSHGWLYPCMYGMEVEHSYLGKVVNKKEETPKVFQEVMDKLSILLEKADYHGAISVEVKIAKDGKPYVIDMTMRYAYPLSLIYTQFLANYSDVIYGISTGTKISPKYTAPYLGCLAFKSEHSNQHWVRMIFDEKIKPNLSFSYCCKIGNYYHAIGDMWIGAFIAGGASLQDVSRSLKSLAPQVDCEEYDPNLQSLVEIESMIQKAKTIGIGF